jgi:hypothetical protein
VFEKERRKEKKDMKAKQLVSLFLIAVMASGMLFATAPLISASPSASIEIDGDVSDWAGIAPIATDPLGDTEPWSKNVTLLAIGNTSEPADMVPLNDKCRDLKALYKWAGDPDFLFFRLDVNQLYQGFAMATTKPPCPNPYADVVYYVFLCDIPGYNVPGYAPNDYGIAEAPGAADINVANQAKQGWEFYFQTDGNTSYAAYQTSTYGSTGFPSGTVQFAVDYDDNAIEFSLKRSNIEAVFGSCKLSELNVIVYTIKPGEPTGSWGNFAHAFDPQLIANTGKAGPGEGPYGYEGGPNNSDNPVAGGDNADYFDSQIDLDYPSWAHSWTFCSLAYNPFKYGNNNRVYGKTKISIVPLINWTGTGHAPCDSFTVNITVEDYNMTSKGDTVGMSLEWDPSVLEITSYSKITVGPWFVGYPTGYMTVPGSVGSGTADLPSIAVDTAAGNIGSGVLFTVEFHVVGYGSTYINFSIPSLVHDGVDLPLAVNDGYFEMKFVPVYKPCEAVIMETPTGPQPVGTTYTIWSASHPATAEETVGNVVTCPIIREDWNITKDDTGENVFSASFDYANSTIEWTCEAEGTYTVLLEIWCDASGTNIPESYLYDSATASISNYVPMATGIDCFTNKMRLCGYEAAYVGFREETPAEEDPADAYALDEEVTLYAWVVYNNNPMQSRLVSFEIYSPLGLFTVFQNMTDSNGIAWVKFRLPTACENYSAYMGKWHCFQKVKLCDKYYNDTVWWDVGWIVELLSVDAPDTIDMYGHLSLTITVQNIAMAPRHVLFDIEVLDDNNVPVIHDIFMKWIDGGEFCNPHVESIIVTCLTFPKWTYPGTGKVVVNAWFNGLPTQCGHCCCPPVTDTLLITCPAPPKPDP